MNDGTMTWKWKAGESAPTAVDEAMEWLADKPGMAEIVEEVVGSKADDADLDMLNSGCWTLGDSGASVSGGWWDICVRRFGGKVYEGIDISSATALSRKLVSFKSDGVIEYRTERPALPATEPECTDDVFTEVVRMRSERLWLAFSVYRKWTFVETLQLASLLRGDGPFRRYVAAECETDRRLAYRASLADAGDDLVVWRRVFHDVAVETFSIDNKYGITMLHGTIALDGGE